MSRLILLLLIAIGLGGCLPGAPAVNTPTPAAGASPAPLATRAPAGVTPLFPLPTPVQGGGSMTVNPAADNLVALARADLTRRLAIPDAGISVVKVQDIEWPDSSLGCPKPGQMYAQVITPGYIIVLAANGKQYEYHASTRNVILCSE